MAKRNAGLYLAGGIIAGTIIAGILILFFFQGNGQKKRMAFDLPPVGVSIPHSLKYRRVHLYFADRNNEYLMAETRSLALGKDDLLLFAETIIQALIDGPKTNLTRTLPSGTALTAVYIDERQIAYLDFSAQISENHPGGVMTEWLSIYSIINSLILNIDEIQAVKILINHQEAQTLAGHIDLQKPLKANMLLIR